MVRKAWACSGGFSLLEVMIATMLLAGALVSLAQLLAVATTASAAAGRSTYATVLAAQKMEQLRALAWGFDESGLPRTDTTTDTAAPDEPTAGGAGLRPSPADALERDVAGYADYVDRFGRMLGGGGARPAGAVFVRRWSVAPLPPNPERMVLLQVFVTTRHDRTASASPSMLLLPDEAWLASVKTRKAP